MTWVIVGLGNPDDEHIRTRHNAGRMAVETFVKSKNLGEWKDDKKSKSFVSRGLVGKAAVVCILPNTYMNRSGNSVQYFIKGLKPAERMIVVYDELDLPLGSMKISFDRGSGGHKGLDSIMRAVKTRRFTRIRLGISPVDDAGAVKKVQGGAKVEKFILGEFQASELSQLKKMFKRVDEAIETIITQGHEAAMNIYNTQ